MLFRSPRRLVFASPCPKAEHLGRHRFADLFLDTWCVNGGTTASDALWAGLPLLTRAGDTFGGRVAASLLSSLGLSELIARDAQQYESIALDLARAPQRLAQIRQQLVAARTRSALFDTRGFVRDFEDVLQAMMQRERAGLKPADFGP